MRFTKWELEHLHENYPDLNVRNRQAIALIVSRQLWSDCLICQGIERNAKRTPPNLKQSLCSCAICVVVL